MPKVSAKSMFEVILCSTDYITQTYRGPHWELLVTGYTCMNSALVWIVFILGKTAGLL